MTVRIGEKGDIKRSVVNNTVDLVRSAINELYNLIYGKAIPSINNIAPLNRVNRFTYSQYSDAGIYGMVQDGVANDLLGKLDAGELDTITQISGLGKIQRVLVLSDYDRISTEININGNNILEYGYANAHYIHSAFSGLRGDGRTRLLKYDNKNKQYAFLVNFMNVYDGVSDDTISVSISNPDNNNYHHAFIRVDYIVPTSHIIIINEDIGENISNVRNAIIDKLYLNYYDVSTILRTKIINDKNYNLMNILTNIDNNIKEGNIISNTKITTIHIHKDIKKEYVDTVIKLLIKEFKVSKDKIEVIR